MQSSNSQNEPNTNMINMGQIESLKSPNNYFPNNFENLMMDLPETMMNLPQTMMNLPQPMPNLPLNNNIMENRMEMEETDFFRGFFNQKIFKIIN